MLPNLPIALTNTFYQQWGLVGVVIGTLAIFISFLRWLWNLDVSSTWAARLKIVNGLAGMFQNTVLEEAEKVIELIDDYLPTALSQADDSLAQPSAFDDFCRRIRELEDDEFNREVVRFSLTESLAGILSTEVRRLIHSERTSDATGHGGSYNLYSGFEFETQQKLRFLAKKSVQAKKKENRFDLGRRWIPRFWVSAMVFLLLFIPSAFFNREWAFYLGAGALLLFVGTMVIGAYVFLTFHNSRNWLEEESERCLTPDDWFAESS